MQRRTGGRGLAAVLFTDIVGSTAIAAEMGNTRWSELVARHHRIVRRTLGRFGGHEVDTAGDGFFATFERPADAIRCAFAVTEAVHQLGIEVRAGVCFGELETTGRKPSGLVVNTAARVMSVAGPGEVLVPASVREIVPGAGIAFTEHGVHQLKGLEGEFRLFKVTEVDGAPAAPPLEVEEASERRREIFPTPVGGPRSSRDSPPAWSRSSWPGCYCSAVTVTPERLRLRLGRSSTPSSDWTRRPGRSTRRSASRVRSIRRPARSSTSRSRRARVRCGPSGHRASSRSIRSTPRSVPSEPMRAASSPGASGPGSIPSGSNR